MYHFHFNASMNLPLLTPYSITVMQEFNIVFFFFCIKRINKGEATTISRSFYRTMSPANNLVSPPFPTFLDINEKELISIFFKYNLTTFNPMQLCLILVYFKFCTQMEHSKNIGDYKTILGTTISNKYGIIHVKKM